MSKTLPDNRAYSKFEVKSVDDEKRIITGMATTPTPDRMEDVVEPKGVEYELPIPFLWQHNSEKPVGHVIKANVTSKGIEVQVRIERTDDPGPVKDRLDTAWQDIKLRLVRGLSIGFKALETARIEGTYGVRYLKWLWLELSAVTIAANGDCSIENIKSIDCKLLAASGREQRKQMDMESMPMPAPDETQPRFMARCVDHMLNCSEDMTQSEASAHCAIRWENRTAMSEQMSATVVGHKQSNGTDLQAASGRKHLGAERTVLAGVTASKSTHAVKAKEPKTMAKKSIAEQIAAFEATRQAKAARMDEIMDEAGEKGETLDAAGKEEHDTLRDEVKEIDDHLGRLRDREKINKESAVEVKGANENDAVRSRNGGIRVQVRGGNVPPGIGFVRLLAAKTAAYLSKGQFSPLDFAKARPHWQSETPEVEQVLKAAVSAGTTTDSTWAEPLAQYQNLANEFVEYLRPLTIIGRIQGLRRVPFLVKFPRQTGAAVASWVGQAKPKPATSLAFDSLTLDPLKVAGIVPISMELMRLSTPSAEAIIRDDLAGAIAQLVDHDFLDPEKAAVANVSPASVTNGVTPVAATGTTYAYLTADMKSVMANFFAANITPDTVVMKQSTALAFSLMVTSLGNPQFPGLSMNGGTFMGMNTITSQNMDYTEDSPQEGDNIIFLRANDIALADDGGVEVDVSTEASIEMSTTPTDPSTASVELISLWQRNLVGIRAERMVNWVKRRSAAVQYISAAKYA